MFVLKLIPSNVLSLQARKPTGLIGRYVMTKIFNTANADLNAFVQEVVALENNDRVLEIGFGPGKLINEMAKNSSEILLEGVDFSDTMLKVASKANEHYIREGRVRLHKAESSNLPFNDAYFDKVYSINTLYFWEDPKEHLSEIYRVLKPGGAAIIGFRDDKQMSNLNLSEDIFKTYSQEEVVNLLLKVKFSDANIVQKEGKPFISYCAVATKA